MMTSGSSLSSPSADAPLEQIDPIATTNTKDYPQDFWLRRLQQRLQKRLLETISVSILISLSLMGTSAWNIWRIYQGLENSIVAEFRLQKLSGDIVHLDEVLTMSARMGASTSSPRWETRYNEYVPQLDKAINAVLAAVPVSEQSNPEKTDEANQRLVAYELQAFELVRNKKAPQALQLLLGPDYEAQKTIYNNGIQGTLATLRANLQTQINNYRQRLIWSFAFSLLGLVVLALTWYIVYLAVQGYIRERKKSQAALEKSKADLQFVNEQLESQVTQEMAENTLIQDDIGHILEVVSAIEYGDLTIEAEVNERATGLVADTLNRLIESLHGIISVVAMTADQVTANAEQLETLAVDTADRAQNQTRSVTDVRSLMENVNTLTDNSRAQVTSTEAALALAKDAVEAGQKEMNGMIQGISFLEQGTDQIVKRTQLLSEFVDLASQFSKNQKRVASLTKVLALNASMLSTRALKEKDPTQFASIAKEFEAISRQVNNLATETNQTLVQLQQRTDQIQTVTSGLTQDVDDINQLVQKFTNEVSQSQRAFTNMQAATNQVAQTGQQVRQANEDIFEAVNSTLLATQTISREAEDTVSQANITREQAASMGELARALTEMVEFFRLSTPQTISGTNTDDELKSAHLSLGVAAKP